MSGRTILAGARQRLSRLTGIEAAVGVTLVLLAVHVARYWFLTDDAYISFRYARNLSDGYGLVFNPGHERVEGYTNFLWVVLLAGFQAIGRPPELIANVLSAALTAVLWALVVWFVYRCARPGAPRWPLVIAPLFLASTRSVAVWATSGLETRLFEVLVVAGALRLVVEVESELVQRRYRPLTGLLLALATLTRPDGVLISLAALAAAASYLAFHRRWAWRALPVHVAVLLVLVGGHLAFRLLYYGEWLPNTYYAKVGGRTWWSMGWVYLGLFALEYAVYLWVPLIVAAVLALRRRRASFIALLFAAIIVPHALYVAAIGGDHFEYRPLNLYFPLIFILLFEGARELAARGRRWSTATAAYLVLVFLGLVLLPDWSHRAFPNVYLARFPGRFEDAQASVDYLRPDRHPILRLPILREITGAYRALLRQATACFVALRQEEHRLCLDTLVEDGRRLRQLIDRGVLPRDAHVALACVGAVPYLTNFRVLDQLGLTDAHVARTPPITGPRLIAHDKYATVAYARQVGVELWAVQASHLLLPPDHRAWARMVQMARSAPADTQVYVADVGDEHALCVALPQGLAQTRPRFPALNLRPLARPDVEAQILQRHIDALRRTLALEPGNHRVRAILADALLDAGRTLEAIGQYRIALQQRPADSQAWRNLAAAHADVGDVRAAAAAAEQGFKAATQHGDDEIAAVLERELRGYRAAAGLRPGTPPGLPQ